MVFFFHFLAIKNKHFFLISLLKYILVRPLQYIPKVCFREKIIMKIPKFLFEENNLSRVMVNIVCPAQYATKADAQLQIHVTRLGCWVKNSADDIFKYLSYFPQEVLQIGTDISCKSSPKETICMKCLSLFPRKSKKNIINLSFVEFAQMVLAVTV